MGIPANPLNPGRTVSGKISWFGGPNDPSAGGTPASGVPITTPGIATYNRATLGGYFLVTAPNGRRAVLRQTDLGPSPSTGRSIDFTYSSLPLLGYSQGNFPTDAVAHATYLGRSVPAQYRGLLKGGAAPQTMPGPRATPATPTSPATFKTTTTHGFDQAGFQAAQKASVAGNYLAGSVKDPYAVGAPKTGLEGAASLAGILPTVAPNPADYQTAQTQLEKIAGKPLNQHPAAFQANMQAGNAKGGNYVNPLPGATWEQTDMGVDASMPNGAPIHAITDSTVTNIHTFYKGQPIITFKILNGPDAGKFYYISEAINSRVHVGQTVRAGQVVGTYNSGGTGLELGWAGNAGGATLTQTTAPQEVATRHSGSGTTAGRNFRNFLNGLGANAG